MDEQVHRLVEKIWVKAQNLKGSKRLLIGIAGIPGSGKSTLAETIVNNLNEQERATFPGKAIGLLVPLAYYIPMDGFHLTRAQLSAMPDPEYAHARRGAAFTFDGEAYVKLLKELRKPITPEHKKLYAPSFNHALKDPVPNDIAIAPQAKVVVFEGNYVALDEEPWREAASLLDEVWYLQIDESVARERLIKRHVRTGVTKNEEAAARRADENDLVNGREIMNKMVKVDEVIKSVDDSTFKSGNLDVIKDDPVDVVVNGPVGLAARGL